MQLAIELITGIMCGYEYVYDSEENLEYHVIDFFFIRFMVIV